MEATLFFIQLAWMWLLRFRFVSNSARREASGFRCRILPHQVLGGVGFDDAWHQLPNRGWHLLSV